MFRGVLDFSSYGYLKDNIIKGNAEKLKQNLEYYTKSYDVKYAKKSPTPLELQSLSVNSRDSNKDSLLDHAFQIADTRNRESILTELLAFKYLDLNSQHPTTKQFPIFHLVPSKGKLDVKLIKSFKERGGDISNVVYASDAKAKVEKLLGALRDKDRPLIDPTDLRNILIKAIGTQQSELLKTLSDHTHIKDLLNDEVIFALIEQFYIDDSEQEFIEARRELLTKLLPDIPIEYLKTQRQDGNTLLHALVFANDKVAIDTFLTYTKDTKDIIDRKNEGKASPLMELLQYNIQGLDQYERIDDPQDFTSTAIEIAISLIKNGAKLNFSVDFKGEETVSLNPLEFVLQHIEQTNDLRPSYINLAEEMIKSENFHSLEPTNDSSLLYSVYKSSAAEVLLPALLQQYSSKSKNEEPATEVAELLESTVKNYKPYDQNKVVLLIQHIAKADILSFIPEQGIQAICQLLPKISDAGEIQSLLATLFRRDLKTPFIKINRYYSLFSALLDLSSKSPAISEQQKQYLHLSSLILAHCFWRDKINKDNSQIPSKAKADALETALLSNKVQKLFLDKSNKNKEKRQVLYNLLRTNAVDLNPNAEIFHHHSIFEILSRWFGTHHSFFSMLIEQQDLELLSSLLHNPGFTLPTSEGNIKQFIEKLLQAKDGVLDHILKELIHANKENFYEKLLPSIVLALLEGRKYVALERMMRVSDDKALEIIAESVAKQSVVSLLGLYNENQAPLLVSFLKAGILTDTINIQDAHGNTLLHYAASHRNLDLLKILLAIPELQLNRKNSQGLTPLLAICASRPRTRSQVDAKELVTELIAKENFNWEEERQGGELPPYLIVAILAGNTDLALQILQAPGLQKQLKIDLSKKAISQAFTAVIRAGNIDILENLIEGYGTVYEEMQKDPASNPLRQLLDGTEEHTETLIKLLEYPKTSVNQALNEEGDTLLSYALSSTKKISKQQDLLKALLDRKELTPENLNSSLTALYRLYHQIKHDPAKENKNLKESLLTEKEKALKTLLKDDRINPNSLGLIQLSVFEKESARLPQDRTAINMAHLIFPTSLLAMAIIDGESKIVEALLVNKQIQVNEGTAAKENIPALSPAAIAYELLYDKNGAINKSSENAIWALAKRKDVDWTSKLLDGTPVINAIYTDVRIKPAIKEAVLQSFLQSDIQYHPDHFKGQETDNLFMLVCLKQDYKTFSEIQKSPKRELFDPADVNSDGQNALILAIGNFHDDGDERRVEFIETLLKDEKLKNALNHTDKYGYSAFHYACAKGIPNVFDVLTKQEGLIIDKNDPKLIMAAYTGAKDYIIDFIKERTGKKLYSPNLSDANNNSLLHYIAFSSAFNSQHDLQSLIEEGADINKQNVFGITPLMAAVGSGSIDKIKMLLAQPTLNPNLADKNGNTPLMVAIDLGDPEIIDLLLQDHRTDLNLLNKDGVSALMIATYKDPRKAETKDLSAINTTISSAYDLKADQGGYVWKGDPSTIKAMIQRGADPLFHNQDISFSTKMLLSIARTSLLVIANKFLLAFNPILQRLGSLVIAWDTASNIGTVVGETVENQVLKSLDLNKVNLTDLSIIGNYHVDKLGRIQYGTILQKLMESNPHYSDANKIIATPGQLKERLGHLSNTQALQIHNDLLSKYYTITQTLATKTLLPWTRSGLQALATEILEADRVITFSGSMRHGLSHPSTNTLAINLPKFINAIKSTNVQNFANFIKEQAKNEANKEGISQVQDLIQKIIKREILVDADVFKDAQILAANLDSLNPAAAPASINIIERLLIWLQGSTTSALFNECLKEINSNQTLLQSLLEIHIQIKTPASKDNKTSTRNLQYPTKLSRGLGGFLNILHKLGIKIEYNTAMLNIVKTAGKTADLATRISIIYTWENALVHTAIGGITCAASVGLSSLTLASAGIGAGCIAVGYAGYKGFKALATRPRYDFPSSEETLGRDFNEPTTIYELEAQLKAANNNQTADLDMKEVMLLPEEDSTQQFKGSEELSKEIDGAYIGLINMGISTKNNAEDTIQTFVDKLRDGASQTTSTTRQL